MRKTFVLRFAVVIMLMVCLLSSMVLPVCATETTVTDVLAETKRGVVQIYGLGYDSYNDPEASWIGSGFCVGNEENGNGIFVTNWHVATGNGEYDEDHVRLWILQENCEIQDRDYQPDPGKSIECTIRSTTYGYPDFAIIETKTSVTEYKALPLLSSEEIAVGETVYALGYPASVTAHGMTNSGIDDITVTNGIVSQHMQDALADETWVLVHTALISEGNSGGPLITEQGAVVGVNTYLFDNNRYCAVYMDYIMDALDEESISYQIYETPTEPSDKPPVDPETFEISNGVIIALVLTVAAVVSSFVFFGKRKVTEEEENTQTEPDVTQPVDSDKRGYVVEAEYKLRLFDGRIIPVNKNSMTLGRDPGCDIYIKDEDNKVSRCHCRLEILQGTLILSDTGSRNGTFIHGKQVPANTRVALKHGSSFAIGKAEYIITVC